MPRINVTWQSRTFFLPFNQPELSNDPYANLDLRLSWRSEDSQWSIETFVMNVSDVDAVNSIFLGPEAVGAKNGPLDLVAIGNRLRHCNGRVLNGLRLEKGTKAKQGVRWRVVAGRIKFPIFHSGAHPRNPCSSRSRQQ